MSENFKMPRTTNVALGVFLFRDAWSAFHLGNSPAIWVDLSLLVAADTGRVTIYASAISRAGWLGASRI